MDRKTFERGGRLRTAATPAQAVQLKFDGWREVTEASACSELERMTVAQLRDFATDNDIDLGDATRKADILAAVVAAGETNEEPEAEQGSDGNQGDSNDTTDDSGDRS